MVEKLGQWYDCLHQWGGGLGTSFCLITNRFYKAAAAEATSELGCSVGLLFFFPRFSSFNHGSSPLYQLPDGFSAETANKGSVTILPGVY